jgi:hypothetical protein
MKIYSPKSIIFPRATPEGNMMLVRYDNVTLSPFVLGEGYDSVPFNVMEQRPELFTPGGFLS